MSLPPKTQSSEPAAVVRKAAPKVWRAPLIGFFLAVIYAVPLSQTALEVFRGSRPLLLDAFTQPPTSANLRGFERELERASMVAEAVRPWTEYVWLQAFHHAGEKAVLGRDGWMFYRPDVQYLIESASSDNALRAIVRYRDRLAARGIHLLVVPAPGKPSVYPEHLTRRVAPGAGISPTRGLIAGLRAARVETLDLFADLAAPRPGQPWYRARDTHWTAAAARKAAESAAARIRGLGWFAGGSTKYTLRPLVVRRPGDLVKMMHSGAIERTASPEEVPCDQVLTGDGRLYRDLPESPVLVLGDSFLRIYQNDAPGAAGFVAHLARALDTPVASIVNDGGASTLVRQQLAGRPDLLRGKKVVLWEFVERDIRFGADGWQDVPLP
jgi:hypothetical protein